MAPSELNEDEVAAYWDQNALLWAEHVRKGWDAYREFFNNPAMFEFVGDLSGKTVLDAGCGEGLNTRLLAQGGAKIVGVDISAEMIKLARQTEQAEPLGIRYAVASFCDLAVFDDESFDTVVSFMALMDGPDYERAVRELFRVLRAGGELIFSILHPCFSTRGYGWVRDEQGNCVKMTVSDYFTDQPSVEHWRFSKGPIPEGAEPFAVPRFPRTLSAYIDTLIQTGFALTEIAEPRPSEQACKGRPWLQRFRDHAGLFLYVRAVKP